MVYGRIYLYTRPPTPRVLGVHTYVCKPTGQSMYEWRVRGFCSMISEMHALVAKNGTTQHLMASTMQLTHLHVPQSQFRLVETIRGLRRSHLLVVLVCLEQKAVDVPAKGYLFLRDLLNLAAVSHGAVYRVVSCCTVKTSVCGECKRNHERYWVGLGWIGLVRGKRRSV